MIKIDGVDLESIGLILLPDHQNPGAPDTRDYIETIPGMNGAYDYGADFEPRYFEFSFQVKPQASKLAVTQIIRKAKRLFLDDWGKPKTVKLEIYYEPDIYYKARYSGSWPIERLIRTGTFNLPMTAFDPAQYSKTSNDKVTWGSKEITFANMMYTFGHTGGGKAKSITLPQNYPVYVSGLVVRPVITITGTGTNVTLSTNSKACSLGTFTNTNWIIDLEEYTVIRNGVNGLSDFNGDFLEFMPGQNQISIGGSNLNFTIQVKFEDKFM